MSIHPILTPPGLKRGRHSGLAEIEHSAQDVRSHRADVQPPAEITASHRNTVRRVAMLGNHLPRQCGIATFTTDLSNAIAAESSELDCFVLAMNDETDGYEYPSRVRFEIGENDLASYLRAADFVNMSTVDVVSVQHEYGIFGGAAGAHVTSMLRQLRVPIVTTLHTILNEPDPGQRRVMEDLTSLSERIVVMSDRGAELVQKVHNVPAGKIDLIPHGIPTVPSMGASKGRLDLEGKLVLLTFGLLSPDKGIEYVIDALPRILARFPETMYIVLGATHPHVRQHHGETYRNQLEARANQLGVEDKVVFHSRFVCHEELAEFLGAADIYVTPSLQPEQSTSGTLAYAVGAGKAVISTPYVYARELLADGRGTLVPWRDSDSIGSAVIELLGDDTRRLAVGQRAAAYAKSMQWPAVARGYLKSFEQARVDYAARRQISHRVRKLAEEPAGLPEIDLAHLRLMTDDTGLLQHAIYGTPRYGDGYCLDDNARALLLMTLIEDAGTEDVATIRTAAARYLAFVSHAFDGSQDRFRNFMSYERHWTEAYGSEDSHGRTAWALGALVGRLGYPGRRSLATDLFHSALHKVPTFSSPRAWAYTLLGMDEYLAAFEGDREVESVRNDLADRLLDLYEQTSRSDWPWFEERATYCNGRIPQALLVSGVRTGNKVMIATAMRALKWLTSIQTSPDGYFAPVGSKAGVQRGVETDPFDHQPVEASVMVSACLDAHRVSGERCWMERAHMAFDWFLGENHLQYSLYDASTGGCRDGLHADRPNANQGAESTLSFLLALLDMQQATRRDLLSSKREDQTE